MGIPLLYNIDGQDSRQQGGVSMDLAARLHQLIEESEITQKELSIQLHMAPTTLNGYVNHYREPDFSTLVRLARYFHVTTDYLLGLSDLKEACPMPLSEDEGRLVGLYRRLLPEKRDRLIEQAKTLYRFEQKRL